MAKVMFMKQACYSFMTIYYYSLTQSQQTRADIGLKKVKSC
jgi:hypothetical protein